MTEQNKKRKPQEERARPAGPSKRPSIRVIPGEEPVEPLKRRPPKIRVVTGEQGELEERLTLKELKERFAGNLDGLLKILGLTRKQAAHEIGVTEKLMRRLASAGVSFSEARNEESLKRIENYFALPSFRLLWRPNAVRRLLTTDVGEGFLKKFRNRLLAERERQLAGAQIVGPEEVALVGRALGVEESPEQVPADPRMQKVAEILASPLAEAFERVIDAHHELVKRVVATPDEKRTTKQPAVRA